MVKSGVMSVCETIRLDASEGARVMYRVLKHTVRRSQSKQNFRRHLREPNPFHKVLLNFLEKYISFLTFKITSLKVFNIRITAFIICMPHVCNSSLLQRKMLPRVLLQLQITVTRIATRKLDKDATFHR